MMKHEYPFAELQRRQFTHFLLMGGVAGGMTALGTSAWAQGGLADGDMLKAVQSALSQGAQMAVKQLGQSGGFLNNPNLKIELPASMQPLVSGLKLIRQDKWATDLVVAMNQAAEKAIPMTAGVLKQAIEGLGVADVRQVVGGGDTGVTSWFADKTRQPLTAQVQPLVQQSMNQTQVGERFDRLSQKLNKLGLFKPEDVDLNAHITAKALGGLYDVIGQEERRIRQNPAAAASALVKQLFGHR